MSQKVYEVITGRIIEQLEKGVVPWRKPWNASGIGPTNLISKKPYRGFNVFILGSAGYGSPYWVSYKQAKQLGGQVKRGEKGWPVTFWNITQKVVEDENGEKKVQKSFILRYYTVFNVEQCENLDERKIPAIQANSNKNDPIEKAEQVVECMPQRPELTTGGDSAFYIPSQDRVNIPSIEAFISSEEYYSTLFHELGHSTMHETRLNRKVGDHVFGSEDYSKEELTAEMTAAFLCGHCEILDRVFDNSAAYIKGWLSKLKDDPKLLIQAGGQAQKAADFILNIKHENNNAG